MSPVRCAAARSSGSYNPAAARSTVNAVSKSMPKLQNIFKVVSNEKLCPRFYRLCIDAKSILKKILPGQFIHIRTTNGLEPFFRRPFSVYRAQKHVEIFYEPVGPGTA